MEDIKEKNEVVITQKDIELQALKKLEDYRNLMAYMAADAPISVLNIPKSVEKVLHNQGVFRVYDLINRDFTKIEGISESRLRNLTTSFNQFISMCS